jgi:hypothetical protein
MPTSNQPIKKAAKKPWGAPYSIFSYKIGQTVHQVRLGADGRPVPGSMIDQTPSILGFGKRKPI